ncbi:TetR/AcrR family transcriptional regulator [Actinomadura harenae]|uniref:TetR/AcrR family transcriptional regulator n=1 Tax=Actinomadura harenae TaxID=2483351 RepID=A0A3M2LKP6_9ACTN|nr:TetR/AcrR family transcriptional regulator [Actinomadura harenae]RMI38052.1 TetR/AcrR family transcriptional regulator [Actinomadura harenae]
MGRVAGLTSEEARERLLAAAAEVFVERGYAGTATGEIARRAGLSTGAIYSRYASKAELLADAIKAHMPAELARLISDGALGVPVPDVVQHLGEELPHRPRQVSAMLVEGAAAARRDPRVAEIFSAELTAHLETVEGLVVAAQEEGSVDSSLPSGALSRFLLSVALGTLFTNMMDLAPVDDADWATVINRFITAASPND